MLKSPRILAFILLASCNLCSAGSAEQDADSLEFHINLDKAKYLNGEGVYLDFSVVNPSRDSANIAKPDYYLGTVELKFSTPEGDSIPWNHVKTDRPRNRVIQRLAPRDSSCGFLLLADQYGSPIGEGLTFALPTGRYRVEACYLGSYWSGATSFEIEEPTGIEAKVFAGLKKINAIHSAASSGEVPALIDSLSSLSPESPYGPELRWLEAIVYRYQTHKDLSTYLSLAKKFVTTFPNDHRSQRFLTDIAMWEKPVESRAFFDTILKDYPKSRAVIFIKNILRDRNLKEVYRGD